MNCIPDNSLRKCIAIVLTILACFGSAIPVASAASSTITNGSSVTSSTDLSASISNATVYSILQSTPVRMDQDLFISTVPTFVNIGQNYSVQVLVNNNSNQSIPILLRLNGPVDVLDIHPFLIQFTIQPGGQLLANFTLIAFNRFHQGAISVSAMLWIWFVDSMSRPQLVQQITANIYGVNPSFYSEAILLIASLGTISAVLIISFYVIRFRRSLHNTERNNSSHSRPTPVAKNPVS